ncbi:MAG: iron ABC transporter permease [Clostridia bacterium]|nr:iron ABC transporter permease [Clostridia bacterium]
MQKDKRTGRITAALIILFVLMLVLVVLNISIGSYSIPADKIISVFRDGPTAEAESLISTMYAILHQIRLPRLLACLILGGALGLAGFLLQTFFGNPIAGPYVLGISSGAKLTVALTMVFVMQASGGLSSAFTIMAAFVGAMISMGFVLVISQKVSSASMLIVSGVMVGYICSAITDFVVTFASDASIVNLHNWSKGSFSGISWENVQVMAVVVIICSVCTFLMAKPISAYQLGEDYAMNMGVNIKRFRFFLVLLSSLLAATVTAFAGPISFVGIAVPHIVKRVLGTAKPIVVIPGCFLGGAIFCLLCDLIARTVFSPTELSISSVTAIFGAPIVISIMIKRRREA